MTLHIHVECPIYYWDESMLVNFVESYICAMQRYSLSAYHRQSMLWAFFTKNDKIALPQSSKVNLKYQKCVWIVYLYIYDTLNKGRFSHTTLRTQAHTSMFFPLLQMILLHSEVSKIVYSNNVLFFITICNNISS